jgi:hypothetical protein
MGGRPTRGTRASAMRGPPTSGHGPGITYLTAPCNIRTFVERRWRHVPLTLFCIWLSVDGSYAIYWHFKDPWVLETMRSANAPISLLLYCLCGFIWLYRGSLRELYPDVRHAVRRRNQA